MRRNEVRTSYLVTNGLAIFSLMVHSPVARNVRKTTDQEGEIAEQRRI